ncbi:endonuclease III domain-containing protein [Stygiolobus caldivivus]|uniref:Endonuclease III n=1 Tax=Stygiolobus caldivivus TaxID=2824673 RepID=A0A8D5U8H3_9CREN|nr:endonuclease III domain-containing protein [Stygiolobus caldivivus]BCU71298.1 endonuclease III [Stygiolobus caldivivus]
MCTAREIYSLLKNEYPKLNDEEFIAYYVCNRTKDLFKTLVATILSQNSTDKSAMIAYKNLENNIGIDPDLLSKAKMEDIIDSIRICGLSNSKARYIKNVADIFRGSRIDFSDCNQLKEFLLSIEGIGNKTADVVLVTCLGCKAFPVDTHIRRVITRLGIVGESPRYQDISEYFINHLDKHELLELHHLLITHGRRVCKARKPLCNICVLKSCCEFYVKMVEPTGSQTS